IYDNSGSCRKGVMGFNFLLNDDWCGLPWLCPKANGTYLYGELTANERQSPQNAANNFHIANSISVNSR
ncbi:MAG: hypothetical protein MI756_16550, partial [Chromatiales bacterium]|nr:hypothetical protein [Chromatiales bacterium]